MKKNQPTSARADPGRPALDLSGIDLAASVPEVLAAAAAAAPAESPAGAGLAQALPPLPRVFDATDAASTVVLVDLGNGRNDLGGSALARTLFPGITAAEIGVPQPAAAGRIAALATALSQLHAERCLLAARVRSSGGLIAAAAAMARAGAVGVALNVDLLLIEGDGSDGRMDSGEVKNWTEQVSGLRNDRTVRVLFTEEPGVLLQLPRARRDESLRLLRGHGLGPGSHCVGWTQPAESASGAGRGRLSVWRDTRQVYAAPLVDLPVPD